MRKFAFILPILLLLSCTQKMSIEIANSADVSRENESVEIGWSDIVAKLGDATEQNIVVLDANGEQIASQVLYNGGMEPTGLLFQTTIDANSKTTYTITKGSRAVSDTLVYGRFVPERKDDFAWENNKIAYRMYGPALEATGEISNGIDVWLKRTPNLVINKWYKQGVNYHKDSGEGLDNYKVGRTLGCGAATPILGDSLVLSNNYTSYKVLDMGALRVKFELGYAPFDYNGKQVQQRRIITLDANQNLNTVETIYDGDFTEMDVVVGIVLGTEEKPAIEQGANFIAYQLPEDKTNGTTYTLAITKDKGATKVVNGHIVKYAMVKKGVPYVYKTGGYWSKFGIADYSAWQTEIKNSTERFINDLKITVK